MLARPHIRIAMILLLLGVLVATTGAGGTDSAWVDSMVGAVLAAKDRERDIEGTKYAPYLGQLEIVRGTVRRNDDFATYAAMNRFMDMLIQHGHGISPDLADWLLDYCIAVTPPKFHDLSRHMRRV